MEDASTDAVTPAQQRIHSSRVASIDAARGAAMLFVCLAHFTNTYFFLGSGHERAGAYLVEIGMIASPTFVTVSGLVAGFLAITRPKSFDKLRVKLIDRGLFLLLIGHAVLALSGVFSARGFLNAYKIGYITDAIGFAVIVGPWLVRVLGAKARLVLACVMFGLNWWAVIAWMPQEGFLRLFKEYLIGLVRSGEWGSTAGMFALIPWFAVYLVGTAIGERVGQLYAADKEKQAHVFLSKLGAASIGAAVVAKLGIVLIRYTAPSFAVLHPTFLNVISRYQKFPPGPVYLLFFGGTGILLVAALLEAGRRSFQPALMNQLRQIGLASLFVYVLQHYVYAVALRALHLGYSPFWPIPFIASIVFLASAARAWNLVDGNRFLTVGYEQILEAVSRLKRREYTAVESNQSGSPAVHS